MSHRITEHGPSPVTVVGWDGSPLGEPARAALRSAVLVAGGDRHVEVAHEAGLLLPETRVLTMGDVRPVVAAVVDAARSGCGPSVVLASGDPGLFGIVRRLRAEGIAPVVLPGVSSVAAIFARAGLPWDDALVVSAHGRDPRRALAAARVGRRVAVLTDGTTGPAQVGAALAGLDRTLVVGEHLGMPDERVTRVTPEQAAERSWADPNVVLVLADEQVSEPGWVVGGWPAPTGWALPEEAFDHRDSMVTKAEVRALALARLGPALGTVVWDVGAGSGSVGIECARFGAAVVAVERDGEQCKRIHANARAHDVRMQVVCGQAPAALAGLPGPDAVFVGGGGPEVVAAVAARRPARVVVTLAGLERVSPARDVLIGKGYAVEGTLLSASRLAPLPDGSTRLAATNPVVVVTAERDAL